MDSKTVKVIFVVPVGCESETHTSELMQQAFEACRQNGINTEWSHETNCIDLQLNKTDFLVFQSFEGEVFETVRKTKSVRIVGPWCLLICLTEGRQIPNYPWPIYSVAMSGCTITCSSLSKNEKKDLQEKVEYMAGYFSTNLMGKSTHLITNSVKSEKYIKAAENGIKIMLTAWIDDVWNASLKENVHCNDDRFKKHQCPPFHKLIICCTGLSNTRRNELRQMITENGGEYKEQLHVSRTDIVVCEGGATSAKYKAAKKYNIKCVSMQWVTDSIKNGYAMSDNLYPVKIGTSTPTKEGEDAQPNFSMISNIGNTSTSFMPGKIQFSETTIDASNVTALAAVTPVKHSSNLKRKSDSNEHNDLVNQIDLKQVKMAGPFLDGCGIYIAGFGSEQREKLCKVLNFSGATRYDDISERVTHVIVGDPSCHEIKLLRSKDVLNNCALVKVQWLLDSIAQQSPANEEEHILRVTSNLINEPSSPLSKKSLHLLRTNSNTPVAEKAPETTPMPEAPPEVDIVQQYLQPNASSQEDTLAKLLENNPFESKHEASTSSRQTDRQKETFVKPQNPSISDRDASLSSAVDDDSSQPTEPIFEGLRFTVAGFTEEEHVRIKFAIENMNGMVVPRSYKGVIDYAVVPVFGSELRQSACAIVNDLWVTECWQESEICSIQYFHQPISIKEDTQPLNDCVVTISGYTTYERNFLKNLITKLGGTCQELFSRTTSAKTGLLACTHLISIEATGKKYEAAIKWGLPVLNKDWLLECARISHYAPEEQYIVGKAKCSPRSAEISIRNSKSSVKTDTFTTITVQSAASPHKKATQENLSSKFNASFNTPPVYEKLHTSSAENTPPNRILKNVQNTSGVSSQITPVQKIIAEARRQNLLGTPDQSLPFPKPWDHVDTPETPLGAFINPNPSTHLKKEMVRFLNTLPDYKPRRDSTPLSELKRRLWDKICPPKDGNKPAQPDFDSAEDDMLVNAFENSSQNLSTPTKCIPESEVNNHLQQLQTMLTLSKVNQTNSGSRRQSTVPVVAAEVKDSQPNTIRWEDYMDCDDAEQKPQKAVPVFMFSGIEQEQREVMALQLEKLGAVVTNLANFDPNSTHLICPKPSRNEKILASMAAGKWILHTSYVEESIAQGKFIDEECFEFGNPKSKENVHMQAEKENEDRLNAVHYWRKEITRRGYGAFHDMRIIISTQKRDALVRVLQAGGGMVVDERAPFVEPVHATHCLLDARTTNVSDYVPLAKQGIFCINALYVNDFLQRTASDVRDFILPALAEYYNS